MQDRSNKNNGKKGRQAPRDMVKEQKHKEIYVWLTKAIAIQTYPNLPPNGLRGKDETAILSSRKEENVATNMCPCGTIQKRLGLT